MDDIDDKLPEILPVLPVRDSVIFPGMVIPIIIRDKRSLKLVDETLKKEKKIVVVMEKAHDKKEKGPADIHKIGTVGHVVGLSKGEEGTILVVQGIARVLILEVVSNEPYKKARIKKLEDIDFSGKKINALMTNMLGLFKQIVDLSPHLPDELIHISMNIDKPGALTDMIVATLNLERNKKQEMLACLNIRERLEKLTVFMNEELEVLKMGRNIQERVKKGMDKSQREYYLREQINGSSLNLLVTRFLNKRWWKKLESQLKSLEELYKDLEKEYNKVLKTLKEEINLKGLKNDPQIISIVMKIYSSEYEEGLKKLASDLMEHRIKGLYPSYNEIWRRLSAKYDDKIKAIRDRRKNIQEFAKNIKENIKKEMERLIEGYKLTPEEFEEDAHRKWKELRNRYEYYIEYSEQRGEYRLILRGAIMIA